MSTAAVPFLKQKNLPGILRCPMANWKDFEPFDLAGMTKL
jgi:hypothetical protein